MSTSKQDRDGIPIYVSIDAPCPLCGQEIIKQLTLCGKDIWPSSMYGAAEEYFEFCAQCNPNVRFCIRSYHG